MRRRRRRRRRRRVKVRPSRGVSPVLLRRQLLVLPLALLLLLLLAWRVSVGGGASHVGQVAIVQSGAPLLEVALGLPRLSECILGRRHAEALA